MQFTKFKLKCISCNFTFGDIYASGLVLNNIVKTDCNGCYLSSSVFNLGRIQQTPKYFNTTKSIHIAQHNTFCLNNEYLIRPKQNYSQQPKMMLLQSINHKNKARCHVFLYSLITQVDQKVGQQLPTKISRIIFPFFEDTQ